MNINYWNGKRVLITGHEGFIGSNLARKLIRAGAKLTGIDKVPKRKLSVLSDMRGKLVRVTGDISGKDLVARVVKRARPEVVFHLAAESIVIKARQNPIRSLRSNIEGTWNVMESLRDKKYVEAVLVASSDKAYGISKKLPYTEDTPLNGLYLYNASKTCADILARSYYASYGLPACVIRCGNIYGPGDHNFSRLVPDAIRKAIRNERLYIRSDGAFTRDYIYVDDVVNGYILLAENVKRKKLGGEAFNLGTGNPSSVTGIFKKIEKIFDKHLKKPVILNKAQGEIRHQRLSSKKADRILGWRALYSLEDGLMETVNWYRKWIS
ncbi:MAG: NAD-dependent epimerase/dehydratase family protein [Candidatus Omnitrophica bacterium]|nr:NAD-dependent epimerase/dehydratase family protein [Candidatus Omnitrophota bacterium]